MPRPRSSPRPCRRRRSIHSPRSGSQVIEIDLRVSSKAIEWARIRRSARAAKATPDMAVDRHGQDPAVVVVGVLADEVDPPRRHRDPKVVGGLRTGCGRRTGGASSVKLFLVCSAFCIALARPVGLSLDRSHSLKPRFLEVHCEIDHQPSRPDKAARYVLVTRRHVQGLPPIPRILVERVEQIQADPEIRRTQIERPRQTEIEDGLRRPGDVARSPEWR